MTTTYKGHCDCGATQFEAKLTKDEAGHVLCHCDVCKRMSGGAYTLNTIIDKSALKFTKGGDQLKTYTYKAVSGNNVDCFFCPNCSSNPYHHQHVMGPDKIILRTALLDDAKKLPVAAEIFAKDKFSWEQQLAKDSFDGPPPS